MEQHPLSKVIAVYIKARADAKLEKFDKETAKRRKEFTDETEAATFDQEQAQRRQEEAAKFEPSTWLADAAIRAKQISLVTHAVKFTHTDAKGSSLFCASSADHSPYLASATLKQPQIDVVGNAAALDVASLLKLALDGVSLIDCIAKQDLSPLQPFAKDQNQLDEWLPGFQTVLADKTPSSHKLSKQVYFPVDNQRYHLLSPLYSSSLSQALYQRIADCRYPEEMKLRRKARKSEKYHPQPTVDYVNTAVQTFGGTKPQNVSQLNSSRGGKSFLLSCQPPVWNQQLRLPIATQNAFWNDYNQRIWRKVKALQSYLLKIQKRSSTKPIRDTRAAYVNELIDALFMYAAEIKNATNKTGWSASSKISQAEKLWLDPLRDDEDFQKERELNDWPQKIAEQFSIWLNRKLSHAKLDMGDSEYTEWFGEVIDTFKKDMREMNE